MGVSKGLDAWQHKKNVELLKALNISPAQSMNQFFYNIQCSNSKIAMGVKTCFIYVWLQSSTMHGERKTKNPTACLKTRHNQLSNDLTKMPHLVSKGRVPENTHTPTTNEIKILEGKGVKDSGNSEGERACLIDLVTRCLCPFVCADCNLQQNCLLLRLC